MKKNSKTFLFVTARLPFPPTSGRKMSLYHYCRILSEELGFRLIVASFTENGDSLDDAPSFIDKLIILPKPGIICKIINVFTKSLLLKKIPIQVSLYWNKKAYKIICDLQHNEKPNYIMGDMVRCTEYIKNLSTYKIADLDDLISIRYKRELETDMDSINPYGAYINVFPECIQKILMYKPIKLSIVKTEITLLEKYEIEISEECDKTIFVAEKEATHLNTLLKTPKAMSVPIGVDTDYYYPQNIHTNNIVISFLGAMNVSHNENAVIYFIDEIFPIVLEKYPDAVFYVIGGGTSEHLLKYGSSNVRFTGRVDDVRVYLGKSDIFVCPMKFGSGIKTKILEAMAMGLPVVTTTIGAENIGATDGIEWFIADTPKEFAEKISVLISDMQKRKSIGENARVFIEKNWTWDTAKIKFEELLL